jgi:hypothetical protein
MDRWSLPAALAFVLTLSAGAHAGGAIRAEGGGTPSKPRPGPVTVVNPFDATSALQDLQNHYLKQADHYEEQLRRDEERRYEEDREEEREARRRDAEREYELAREDARQRDREAREAEEQARRNLQLARERQARMDEVARRAAAEDAELNAEEDQRMVDRARMYAEQSRERFKDNVVVKTLIKDISVAVDHVRSETQQAASFEGAVERLRHLIAEEPVVHPASQLLGEGVASLHSMFELTRPTGSEEADGSDEDAQAPRGSTIGGWLADQVREKLGDKFTEELHQHLNRMLGGAPCNIADEEAARACDDAWRHTNPIHLLRGPRTYLQTLLEKHLGFIGMAIPRIQGE